MRFCIFLAGVLIASCGGKVVVDGASGGAGGAGGDDDGSGATGPGPSGPGPTGPGTTTTGPGPSGPGPDTATATTGSGPPPPPGCDLGSDGCIGCAELITFPECTEDWLCPESATIHEALFKCACGICAPCFDNACAGKDATPECQSCVQQTCAAEAGNCANDISD